MTTDQPTLALELLDRAHRVLLVHAHPDDETLASGALIAELVDQGREVHVLTCTRGERGELMPGVADAVTPGSAEFVQLRLGELAGALDALGVEHHAFLGTRPARGQELPDERVYTDSGMQWIREGLAGPAEDAGDESFTAATISDALEDALAYVDSTRPDVLISYDSGGGYGHPDHIRAHEVTKVVAEHAGLPMLEIIPPDRDVDGDLDAIQWLELSRHLLTAQQALRSHASQVRVDGAQVVHVGGQREPIVTRMGLRTVDTART